MKQYILKYKENDSIIGWFCTKEAAWERMKFLTDSTAFGVFEVQVSLNPDMSSKNYIYVGVVITSNNAVLQVFPVYPELNKTCIELCKSGTCHIAKVQYSVIGKELKAPKEDKEQF